MDGRGLSCVHGHTKGGTPSATYVTWMNMRDRCLNPRATKYKDYGGRGICICDRWNSFANFLKDMGERPDEMTLDRFDNDENYDLCNCRWATPTEQARNRKSNRVLCLNGEKHILTEWAEILGVNRHMLYSRLRRGWSVERTLTTK